MDRLEAALAPLRITRLRVRLRSPDGLALPEHQGSSVRGALAITVKNLVCVRRDLQQCAPCPLLSECAYPYLFETKAPQGAGGVRGYESFPRPYVISYASSNSSAGERPHNGGESIDAEIGLALIGSAARYFPYLALALCDLQNRGIGGARRRFELTSVDALDVNGARTPIFEVRTGILQNQDYAIEGEDVITLSRTAALAPAAAAGRLRLRFLSPAALMKGGAMAAVPEFGLLLGSVLRRLSMLALGHCGSRMDLDFAALHRAAGEVSLVRRQTSVVQWERYSNRQRQRVPMRGLVGEVEYKGNIAPFIPALLLGSLVHVGDNCTFGMGRFIVGMGESWLPGGWAFPGEAVPSLRDSPAQSAPETESAPGATS